MNLTVSEDLSQFPITRQDLYDMWATALISNVSGSDLANGFLSVQAVSSYSGLNHVNPVPGSLGWVQQEQLMYCYHDEIDGTGVSLWLCIGPDVFETAALMAEPAFPGATLEPFFDRWVKPTAFTNAILGDGVANKMIGTLHTGVPYPLNTRTPDTVASGTWVRMGIDGLVLGWLPNPSGISDVMFKSIEQRGVISVPTAQYKGGCMQTGAVSGRFNFAGFCGIMYYNGIGRLPWGEHFRFKWLGGFNDQSDK